MKKTCRLEEQHNDTDVIAHSLAYLAWAFLLPNTMDVMEILDCLVLPRWSGFPYSMASIRLC